MASDDGAGLIPIEVAYALPERQQIIALQVKPGTTALAAAQQSGIAGLFGGLDLEASPLGVFGKAVDPQKYIVAPGDRVEIYRPLQVDPKESRKARAAKVKAGKKAGAGGSE
jgi:putative ubiquitin-RnfH superfamily antitoxin RatB of RatAB toxin-antitoxin module